MDNQNITIISGENRFNFRVAVLIENEGRILLESAGEFWNMIGGRVHFGETSLEAASRELKEELGIEVSNLTLINISENFFEWMGKHQQEMLFVYKAVLDKSYNIVGKDSFKCLDSDEVFKWYNKKDIEKLDCRPEIIKKPVLDDNGLKHMIDKKVNREETQ